LSQTKKPTRHKIRKKEKNAIQDDLWNLTWRVSQISHIYKHSHQRSPAERQELQHPPIAACAERKKHIHDPRGRRRRRR
jgi:hypothetical protein